MMAYIHCVDHHVCSALKALLGDSYGKHQLVTEIPEAEFEVLQSVAVEKNLPKAELLAKCYLRDQNAVPPVYVLQVITIIF